MGIVLLMIAGSFLSQSCTSERPAEQKFHHRVSYRGLSLPRIDTGTWGMVRVDSGQVVLIVFSPLDCASCLQILTLLNNLHEASKGNISLAGVIDTPYPQAARKVQEHYRLSFPLFLDSSGTVRKAWESRGKPILMFLDHGIVQEGGVVGDPEDLDQIGNIINTLVKAQQ